MRFIVKILLIFFMIHIGILTLMIERFPLISKDSQNDPQVIKTKKVERTVSPSSLKITTKQSEDAKIVKTIILTYMRSGSSFVGDILQRDPGVLYLFEPLRLFQGAVRAYRPILYQNGSWRPPEDFLKLSVSTLDAWLSCKLENLGLVAWDDNFLALQSQRAKIFFPCFEKEKHLLGIENARVSCVQKLKQVCLSSKSIIIKLIRTPMYLLDSLLEKHRSLKIIHLIRDPRSTLRSQGVFANYKERDTAAYAARYCGRVLRDVFAAEIVERKYPGRILRLFYEDLANKPIPMSKKLYKFTGLKYTSDVETFVRNITAGKENKNCKKDLSLCTVRSDSAAQAAEWRQLVHFNFVQTVDKQCRPLLFELGLKEIPNVKLLRDSRKFKLSKQRKTMDDFRWS